jgi:hypothetical protein
MRLFSNWSVVVRQQGWMWHGRRLCEWSAGSWGFSRTWWDIGPLRVIHFVSHQRD